MNLVSMIIDKIPNDLNDLEKARFIYMELGKILEFDTTTLFNCNDIYFNEKIKKDFDITNLTSNKVNCYNWSNIYVKLLELVHINAEVKEFNDHAWVIMNIDNKTIYADATNNTSMDLAKIKYNIMTDNFYVLVEDDDDLDEFDIKDDTNNMTIIEEIDKKLGYDKKHERSFNELIKIKNKADLIENFVDKINFIFSSIDFSNMGFFEGNDFIRYILGFFLSNQLEYKIKAVTLSKTLLSGDVDSIKCITIEDNNTTYYYIFASDKGIYPISKEKIELIFNMGYAVENFKKIPNIKDVINFKKYDFSKKETIKLKKENLYIKMYKYDEDLNFNRKK